MASIGYMKYYLPKKEITVKQYFEQCKEKIFSSATKAEEAEQYFMEKSGFEKIPIGKKAQLIPIFEQLIQEYINERNIKAEEINYIFYTDTLTVNTEDGLSIPNQIQKKFQFKNASVVEINQQCASCIWTIGMAARLLKEGETGLLLTANMMDGMEERYKPHSVIGDGVAIMEINEGSKGIEILDFNFRTKQYIGEVGFNNNLDMMKSCVKSIEAILKRNNLKKQDLSCIIHQNLSKEIYEIIFKILLGIQEEVLFWDNIKRTAHVGDADLIVNLSDVLNSRSLKNGEKIILFAIGEVSDCANYNCILLQVNK